MRMIATALGGALVLAAALPAQAHHGFEGRYDLSRPQWIEGEVVRAYFGQPHPVLTIRTAPDLTAPASVPDLAGAEQLIDTARLGVRDELKGAEVAVELSPVRQFLALDGKIAAGSRIAVIAFRNCEAPHDLRGNWVRPEGMAAVARPRGSGNQVQGC